MRIAIDARKLHDFGIGTYIRNVLRVLSRIDHDTEYVLLARSVIATLAPSLGPNFRAVPDNSDPYSVREQFSIPWRCAGSVSISFTRRITCLPPLSRRKSVVTIHDCIHLMFPEYLPNRLALTLRAGVAVGGGPSCSNRILTVSETSKRDILRFFDVPAGEDQRHLQRHRRSLPRAAARRGDVAGGAALPARPATSCCMPATSSRTRTSSG